MGATLYKLVTGNTPPQAMDLIDEGLLSLPSSLSTPVVEAIKKTMQFRKADRPSNLSEFLSLLNTPIQQTPSAQQAINEQSPTDSSEETMVLTGKDNVLVDETPVPSQTQQSNVKTVTAEPSLSSKKVSYMEVEKDSLLSSDNNLDKVVNNDMEYEVSWLWWIIIFLILIFALKFS